MSKFRLLLLPFLLFSLSAVAQNSEMRNALTYKFLVVDYNTIDPTYRKENPKRIFHPDDINYGAEIGYFRYLNPSFNVGAPIRFGSIDSYHHLVDSSDANCIGQPCDKRYYRNELFVSLDLVGVYKFNNGYILPQNYWVAPFVQAGLSNVYMQKRAGHFDLQIPMALGVNIQLREQFALQGQIEYRQSLLTKKNNVIISAGFVWALGKKKAEEAISE